VHAVFGRTVARDLDTICNMDCKSHDHSHRVFWLHVISVGALKRKERGQCLRYFMRFGLVSIIGDPPPEGFWPICIDLHILFYLDLALWQQSNAYIDGCCHVMYLCLLCLKDCVTAARTLKTLCLHFSKGCKPAASRPVQHCAVLDEFP
jgi:hypothetical protein